MGRGGGVSGKRRLREAIGDHAGAVRTANQLALVAQGAGCLADAAGWARKVLKIKESIGDPSLRLWMTYNILGNIAEAKGDADAARVWRHKERVAYVAFPGHWANLQGQWGGLVQAVAATARGDVSLELADALDKNMESGWGNVVAVLRALVAGARDADALADAHHLEGIDYLIVRKVLEAVGGKSTTDDVNTR